MSSTTIIRVLISRHKYRPTTTYRQVLWPPFVSLVEKLLTLATRHSGVKVSEDGRIQVDHRPVSAYHAARVRYHEVSVADPWQGPRLRLDYERIARIIR